MQTIQQQISIGHLFQRKTAITLVNDLKYINSKADTEIWMIFIKFGLD